MPLHIFSSFPCLFLLSLLFFFFFSLLPCAACALPCSFFFPPYCSQASLLTQQAARFRAPCLVCILNGVLSFQRRGPWSPSPHWDMILACRRGYFYYFMAAEHKWCIPVLDAPGHGLQQNWRGGHGCPSSPSRCRCAGHLSPPVRRRAAGCLPRHQGLPSVCEATRGKKKRQRKKFHFCFVCPHFICIT